MPAARSSVLRCVSIFVIALLLATTFGPPSVGADPVGSGTGEPRPDPGAEVDPFKGRTGTLSVMIELADAPSVVTFAGAKGRGATETAAGQEAQAQKARIEQAQQGLLGALATTVPSARVLYRVQAAYNGIAVRADAATVPQLRGLAGVKAVHPIARHEPDNATSVPLIGAPTAWQNNGATGAGITIGIIDTGIDYVHTNFGGPGTEGAYAAANHPDNNLPGTTLPIMSGGSPLFPNAKVVGGWDFAGDDYDARDPGSVPAPDPNPQDCNGHGSHVAGTAAGYGVRSNGDTYDGDYGTTVPFETMRIGPGVAPQASLYALRVFGCDGSTDLTVQAIDWAMDPDNNGDLSDRLDVINMSLGSAFGTSDDPSSVASNNAALAGVIVAISAGNNGDLYYVSGSPGSAQRAITVASSVDTTDVVDGFQATTSPGAPAVKIATFSVAYDWPTKPPVTGDLVYNAGQNGCSPFPAGSVTGKVVLVDWAPAGSSTFPCGSVARTNNAQAAGAAGIIMASGQTYFDTAITGNAGIPAVFTTFTVGSELKAALGVGTTSITFSYAYQGSGKFVVPGADDTLSTFSSRGPRGGDNGLKPDISAPGQSIFSTGVGTGNRGASLNGTSMAAPHIAGVMALLKDLHPDWSVEELKALAMNTAGHNLYTGLNQTGDRYGPARVGAGRVDVPAAAGNEVIAYIDGGSGEVSVSFGALEVAGTVTQERTVKVVNKNNYSVTYNLSYDARTTIPGVSISVSPSSVTVPAGASNTFNVILTADAAQMRNTRDNTVAGTQSGLPRQWLSEASGLIMLTPTAGATTTLRVPVYATARPASNMTTEQSQLVFPGPTGSASLTLTGQGVDTGSSYPTDITSVVTALELATTSGPATLGSGVPESARNADLQHVGVMASRDNPGNLSRINNSALYFGIATHGNWSSPATAEFDIYLDLNEDGTTDYILYNTRLTDTDVFVTALYDVGANATTLQDFVNYFSAQRPTAPFNSNVLLMPVYVSSNAADINFAGGDTRFNYRVYTFSRSADGVVDQTEWLTYDYANPGLDFKSGGVGAPMYTDRPGDTLPATFNQAAYTANNSQGALLLHHYNTTGNRAQVVPVRLAQTIDFPQPPAKTFGDPPFVVSATGGGSGNPIVFGTSTPATCTVGPPTTDTSTTVTILAAGACTITADQAGNANYLPAPQATHTFGVAVALTVTIQGPGTLNLGSGSYPVGTPISLVATPNPGAVFTGWVVDGVNKGWANPLGLTMDAPHSVVASFAAAPAFSDVPPGHPATTAIAQLVGRGIVRGYAGDGFGPEDTLQRAQLAAFIARATPGGGSILPPACLVAGSWDCEAWGTPFTDQNGLDANLWRNVGTLAHYGVAAGYGDGTFGPTDPVTYAQTLALITRAMVTKGYWQNQPTAPVPAGVPAVHATDVATFLYYAGSLPAPADWNAPATRGWCVTALWQALNTYWGTDGTLPDGRPAGGLVP